ncbi:MAG: hypothetical protein WAZ27_00585 [Minisyncoccia bacterium]
MRIVGITLLVLVALVGYSIFSQRETSPPKDIPPLLSYSSRTLAFNYPTSYELSEQDAPGSAERAHHTIILTPKMNLPAPIGGEGLPAISIDMYQNNLDKLSTDAWIRSSNDSNFKLSSDGIIATTSVSGLPALSYTWDGLYRGRTIAIARREYIYAFSVTSLTPEDTIHTDFDELLRTVTFE